MLQRPSCIDLGGSLFQDCAAGDSEGGLRGKEWGGAILREVVLPCSEKPREGSTGNPGDVVVGASDSGTPHNGGLS